jgi:8-oxo-dGTP diphosphatase
LQKIKHSVAGISIDKGKIFIARRKPGGDIGEKWEFPGGKVEDGENDIDALIREYREEFGIAVEVGPFLSRAEFTHNGNKYLLNAYRIYFQPGNLTMTEHIEWHWITLDEIAGLDFADSDRRLLPMLKMYLEAEAGIKH